MQGIGLHTGKEVKIEFHPAEKGAGIFFQRTDLEEQPLISASLENVAKTNRGTVLQTEAGSVNTVEHVLAAVKGMGLTNLKITLSNQEPPASVTCIFSPKRLPGQLWNRECEAGLVRHYTIFRHHPTVS